MQEPTQHDFQPVKKRRLSDDVAGQIRARIVSGELRPGDKLPSERDLSNQFSVSRGAVREALRTLELAGVVNIQHGVTGGAFISFGDPSIMEDNLKDLFYLGGVSLEELTEARIWIESLVSRIASERATEGDLAALTANVDTAEAMYHQRLYNEKIDVHIEFHNILARATHNPVMVMLMGALMELMRDFANEVGGEQNDLTIKARRKFLRKLRDRDGDGAAAAMTQHIKKLQGRYADVVRSRHAHEDRSE